MNSIIEQELDKLLKLLNKDSSWRRTDAFTLLSLLSLVLEKDTYTIGDVETIIEENYTNGTRDGGIDAAYLDEDTQVLAILQTKYSESIDVNEVTEEIKKLISTLQRFQLSDTSDYSSILRKKMRELLDRTSDTDDMQYKIIFVSASQFDKNKVNRMLKPTLDAIELEVEIEFVSDAELTDKIQILKNRLDRVEKDQVSIAEPKQFVEYTSDEMKGAFTSVWASSIFRLYELYAENGLFNLNVRKYIARKSIDAGIINTIQKENDDFWFLNNGLTIGAKEYDFDGDVLKLYDFSIVNGAQTTSLIGKHFKNDKDFLVPVKIIAPQENAKLSAESLENFFTEIAESTNSQKPIKPRDLKANAREMRSLRKWLIEDYKVEFRVKQGVKPNSKAEYSIRNDEFAQLIQSFVYQKPGSARSNAKALFENKEIYKSIFISTGFDQSREKRDFVYDLIVLSAMYDEILANSDYNKTEISFLRQSKTTMFAMFGLIYRYQHGVVSSSEVQDYKQYETLDGFEMNGFISTYKQDDLLINLKDIIGDYSVELQQSFEDAYEAQEVGSVSNFFKLDTTYRRVGMSLVRKAMKRMDNRAGVNPEYDIFKTQSMEDN